MASRNVVFFGLIIYLTLVVAIVNSSKLNVPHVLLPVFDKIQANFTLEAANGGCYTWSTTRIDLVQLYLIDPDEEFNCAQKAIVSAISKERARNVAVVLAEEINTHQVLRVDVIVDVIDSLKISTTTREIIMDEVPEIFKVVAFDSQGNLFTSLEGIEFDWKIICLGTKKDLTVLRFMSFMQSPYETPPSIELFEQENKRGHIVLLEGIKTGSTKVQVRLPYEEYSHLMPYEVQLSVVANLLILPADIYVMGRDVVQFKIFSMNNGKMEQIVFPNSQYYLDVESKVVASADPNTGEVTALKEGKTKVVLYDRNVDMQDPSLKVPSASLTVVAPAYITLNLLPHKNWATLLSEHHDITVDVYSSNDHKLYLGSGVQLHTQVADFFHVQQRSRNESWLTGYANQEGVAQVHAVLEGVIHPKLGKLKMDPLSARNDILIYPRIILSPSEVILPWDPVLKPKYQVEITATGGDGKFLWTSSDHAIGHVNQIGQVRTHSEGYFEVSAAMQANHHNRQTAKFHILPPSRLEIVEYIMEAEVGSMIHLHVALFAEKPGKEDQPSSHIPFTRCQDLSFKVKTSDSKFVYNKAEVVPPVGISCANIAIVGQQVGVSKVTVSYRKDATVLEDSVTVTTFKTMRLLHPKRTVVLAVGTSYELIFTGGPRPSIGRLSDYKRFLVSENNQTVEAVDVTNTHSVIGDNDYTVVKVLCRKLGESAVTVSISNTPVIPNCKNKDARVTAKVICGKPRSMSLQPEIKVADADSCPMDLSSQRVVVQSSQDIELDVVVRDENGLQFLNISSLKFDWNLSPGNRGVFGSKDGTFSRDVMYESFNFGNKSYQSITPKVKTGQVDVKTMLVGYRKQILSAQKITPEWPEFMDATEKGTELQPVLAAISLFLVDQTIVVPNEIAIYNHPGNKKRLSVKQGSGFYQLALSIDDVAEVKYIEATREIEITPQNVGELRIHLIDLCLASKPAVIMVSVVSVSIIRVEMSDKVEIGKCIPCIVRLYDESDNLLALPDLNMVDIRGIMDSDIVTVKRFTEDKKADGEVHYVVTGQFLGDTKLTFTISGGTDEITSAPLDIQVFPPLHLYPRNATLLIGSSLQYNQKGGPQPDGNIEYTLSVNDIAGINSGGVLKGLAKGHAQIHAKAVGINPTTGQKIIYTEDTVDVTVTSFTGIKISAPLTRFQIGSRVPMWATGLPEQLSPMVLGTVEPPFQFVWSIEDSDIAEIQGVFQKIGVIYASEDQIAVRLTGLTAGRTKLILNVTVPGKVANCARQKFVTLSDTIDVDVFEGLLLASPKEVSGAPVLMAPYSSIQLQTNMDSVSKLHYKLIGDDVPPGTDVRKSLTVPNPIVTISESGMLKSYGNLGFSMVRIISTDEYGLKQTLSIIVEVKPIHYMMLSIVSNWMLQAGTDNHIIPLGTEFELKATYHDNIGNTFKAGTAILKVRTSRFDLTRIRPGSDNSSLVVSAKKPGFTVIKVWADGIKKTADYVKLHVQQTVTPAVDHLVVGDVVCLWSPVTSRQSGKWSTSDSNLLQVDSDTGIGTAVEAKGGQVSIINSLHPVASLQLKIFPIDEIAILGSMVTTVLTNAPSKNVFKVPLILISNENLNKKSNLMNGWRCKDKVGDIIREFPFTCHIKFVNSSVETLPENIFSLKSGFSGENGLYSCDIMSVGVSDPATSVMVTNVTLVVESNSNDVMSDPFEIHFVPAVYLEPELNLDEDTFSAVLVITGVDKALSDVTVTPADKSLLQVDDGKKTAANTLKYTVRLLDYHWKLDELDGPLTLHVICKLTRQDITVHVKIKSSDKFNRPECALGGRTIIGSFVYNNRQTLAILISMLIIFFVTFYAVLKFITQYHEPEILTKSRRWLTKSCLKRSMNIASGNLFTLRTASNQRQRNTKSISTQPWNSCAEYLHARQLQRNHPTPVRRSCLHGEPEAVAATEHLCEYEHVLRQQGARLRGPQ